MAKPVNGSGPTPIRLIICHLLLCVGSGHDLHMHFSARVRLIKQINLWDSLGKIPSPYNSCSFYHSDLYLTLFSLFKVLWQYMDQDSPDQCPVLISADQYRSKARQWSQTSNSAMDFWVPLILLLRSSSPLNTAYLGQCKARPFNFIRVFYFLFFIFCFSAPTDIGFIALKAKLMVLGSRTMHCCRTYKGS